MTRYHIGNGGSDVADGLTHATRWLTLDKGRTHQAASGVAGDEYALAGGSTWWGEQLKNGCSGIRWTAYNPTPGTRHTPPKVSGAQDLSSAGWTDAGGNLWTRTITGVTASLKHLFFGGIHGKLQALVGDVNAAFEWFFNTGTSLLTVYSVGNPTTVYGTMRLIVQDAVYDQNDKDNCQADGIAFADWGAGGTFPGAIYAAAATSPENPLISRCEFDNGALAALYPAVRNIGALNLVLDHCDVARVKNVIDNLAGASTAQDNKLVGITGYAFTVTTGTCTYKGNRGFGIAAAANGASDGGGNIFDVDPQIRRHLRVADCVKMSLSIDDLGEYPGTLRFVEEALAVFRQRATRDQATYKLGVGVTPAGDAASEATAAAMRRLRDLGAELCNHGWSHASGAQGTLLKLKCVDGDASAATVTVAGDTLTTTITGGVLAQNLNVDLTAAGTDTLGELLAYLNAQPGYDAELADAATVHLGTKAKHLAACAGQDILNVFYAIGTDYASLLPDEIKSAHDWLVAAGVTPSPVFLLPHGELHADHPTYLENATNGAYEGARLALLASGDGENLSVGVNPYKVACQFLSEAICPDAATTRKVVGNIAYLGQVLGLPVVFYTHAFNWTSAEKLGWVLDAILEWGTYASLEEINDYIRGKTAVTANRLYAVASSSLEDVNLALARTSPLRGVGLPVGAGPFRDILDRVVDQFTLTDVGARTYFEVNLLQGAISHQVGLKPRLIGSTSASVATANSGTLTIAPEEVFCLHKDPEQIPEVQPIVVVQLAPGATSGMTVTSAVLDIIPIWESDEDLSPDEEGIHHLCGGRRHDLRRGILGETEQDVSLWDDALTGAKGEPAGTVQGAGDPVLVYECRESLPFDVPFALKTTIVCANASGDTVTMRAAAWIVGLP